MIQLNDISPFVKQLIATPLTAIVTHYAACLLTHPRAVAFVNEDLGLTPEQAEQKQIGFSDRSLGTLIPPKQIKTGREIRESLVRLGIYKANGRETLRGYVTVPIRDEQGAVIGIRGHKVDRHAAGDALIEVGGRLEVIEETIAEQREPSGVSVIDANTKDSDTNSDDDTPKSLRSAANTSSLIAQDSNLLFTVADRQYRIRGLEKNTSSTTLRINLLVSRDSLVHLDSLDLVKARSRAAFIKAAASELFVDEEIIKKDIGQLLLQLETLQADQIDALKKPLVKTVTLTADEEREALLLLRDPNLLQRILFDLDACGIVGESTGKLAGYLAATSRKLQSKQPLAIVIQSSSSAGTTSLMDAILAMMPPEDVQRFSGMTSRSLFYLDSDSIRHRILAISEEEGASDASYALKLLQSEGELRHATVGRGENGKVETQSHHVQGPVQLFLTTTAMQVDEELLNRCLVLSVDETNRQTQAILSRQRDACTLAVTQANCVRDHLRKLHQNAQRLLRPLHVFNPFAPQLTFPSHKARLRRDHLKYLTLIDAIALLHQHQRTVHELPASGHTPDASNLHYIYVERNDIVIANSIAGEVLGRSLDELAPQTRGLLNQLHDFVSTQSKSLSVSQSAYRFTRRDIREAIHWSDSQIRKHLDRLVELEYVLVHRGRNGQRFVYELLYRGEGLSHPQGPNASNSAASGPSFLMGLTDPTQLKHPSSLLSPVTMTATLTP